MTPEQKASDYITSSPHHYITILLTCSHHTYGDEADIDRKRQQREP
jgi:hypothetical protein